MPQIVEERKVDWSFEIEVSVLEIYNENIRDLLADNPKLKLDVSTRHIDALYLGVTNGLFTVSYYQTMLCFATYSHCSHRGCSRSSRSSMARTGPSSLDSLPTRYLTSHHIT